MRIINILKKCIKEILRDWKILFFSLIFGPVFILIFHAFYGSSQTRYSIVVDNSDKQVITNNNVSLNVGNELIKLLGNQKNSDGSKLYNITMENVRDRAIKGLKSKKYDVYIIIPEDFSQSILNQLGNPLGGAAKLNLYGDMRSYKYIVPAITIGSISEELVSRIIGRPRTLNFIEESIITYKDHTDFEATIPSAIFLGIIMLLFTSSIALVREVEVGTIRRLQISKTSSLEMLGAITISQLFIGLISIVLTLFTALTLFHAKTEGSIALVYLISILCCFSIIAIGFILAGFSRNISDILIIGNLPYFLLFLLSGAFPIPRINILSFGIHSIAINDIFPTTPAMTALKMVMEQGKGLNEVIFEIIMMVLATILYFALGIYLFNRKHMKLI
jgi:ABC-2 type transport system permease protein